VEDVGPILPAWLYCCANLVVVVAAAAVEAAAPSE
jgi:hypothetical protein